MLHKYTGSIKEKRRQRRHARVRSKIAGTAERPRVSVTRNLNSMYVQVIDDVTHRTIVGMHSKKIAGDKAPKVDTSKKLGESVGNVLKEQGITTVVFDRGGYAYHGRVKALADGLRESGIAL